MYPNHHFSTPSNNANDVVNSSAPSNISDSARVAPNQTPRCDPSSCSFSDSTCMSNMSHQWSGSNPPPGVAPGCAPDFSSAWNSSPSSMSHAFNLGYNMVAAWGGRPPSIGDAFTQGTLFAQRAATHFQNQGPCFPSPVTPASVRPGPGCVSCGQAPRFTAPLTPSAPPSYAPSHCGTPGTNLSGASRAAAPNVCAPPGFGALSTPPRPIPNTIPGFPFVVPPPCGFPFDPESASVAVGQVPPATPADVAPSTNPASVQSVCDETRFAPYSSSQRMGGRERGGRRSRSPLEVGAVGPSHGSFQSRTGTPSAGRPGVHRSPPTPPPATRMQFRPQCPGDQISRATNFPSGPALPARSTNPWAVDTPAIRYGGPTFPEPDEPQIHYCPISGCNSTSRLVRHATVQHLPWFVNPATVCWLCGIQFVMGTKLKSHWTRDHQGVDMSTNWGPHRFNDYFQKMESFVLSAAAFRGFTSLFDVYQEVTQLNDFALLNPLVKCPGFDLFKAFLTRHGQTPVSEYHILPQPTSMACLLHWRVILQLLVPLTSEQYRQLLAEHGGTPAQAAERRISSEQAAQSEREQDETTQAKQISQVPVAPPRAESAAPESDSPAPQTARQLESSTSQPVPSGERRISLMQVDRPEGATGGTVAPVGRPKVSVAKPRTQAARVAPRPTLPPSSRPQHVNLVPRLMRTTVARPSVSVAVSARVRPSGAPGLVGAMGVAGPRQALPPQRSGPPPLCRPPVPLLLDLEPRGAITVLDPRYSAHPKQHRNYTRVDKTLSPQAYLVDSHFHLDKICVERGMETNNFDALFSPDTPGAHPSVRFPIKSVTCYMLSLKYDSAYSRKELMSFYKPFSTSPDVKLMFCVHPVHAADFKTPTKRVEAVDMCVDHLILPGTVAAGEFGLDYHRVQTAEGRTRSKEFLSLMVKKLVTDDRLKRLPLVLHVREARQTEEEAASKCIGTLRMASFPRDRKIYLHCFCGSTKVAHFWIGAYPHVKFGVSPKNISGNQPSAEYFQSCDLKYLMLETDAPSLFFDPRKPGSSDADKGPPTTPQSTYEVACWLARLRNQPVSEVLEAAAYNFEEFYGRFS